MNSKVLAVGIILLFIVTSLTPMVVGYKSEGDIGVESIDSPMDSAWPMFGHDARHTGRSPYSTENTNGTEVWRFETPSGIKGSPVIDNQGVIYVGSFTYLYAINPNGTLKWKYEIGLFLESSPAIAEDGTIYIASTNSNVDAVSSNGTRIWRFNANGPVHGSPTIGEDGIIYFSTFSENGRFYALFPNGAVKWQYNADFYCATSPTIGHDGTIYFASHVFLYAFYQNGTLKWKSKLGDQNFVFLGGPAIGDDGTIYISSVPGPLFAVYPTNGSVKWESGIDWGSLYTPSVGEDGTIYIGEKNFYAINHNGTRKWTFEPEVEYEWEVRAASYAISDDYTIYFAINYDNAGGGELIALNPDGTLKWRSGFISNYHIRSEPIINENGTVYIASTNHREISWGGYNTIGYVHAIGEGKEKKISIEEPQSGWLYFFNLRLIRTLFGRTIVLGNFNTRASVSIPEEVEKVTFRLKSQHPFKKNYEQQWLTYEDLEFPYDWHINRSDLEFRFCSYNLEVTAYYSGGCTWTESVDIFFIKFL